MREEKKRQSEKKDGDTYKSEAGGQADGGAGNTKTKEETKLR